MKKQAKRGLNRDKREARKELQQADKAKRKPTRLQEKEARHQARRAPPAIPPIPRKKRKQHYVWQHYLSAWTRNELLWCQMEGRRFPSGTNGVAHSRDFYRLKEMTPADLRIVDQLIVQRSAPHLRELLQGYIPLFQDIFGMKNLYEASGKKNEEIENLLEVVINNTEEDLHAHIEQEALSLLALLRDGKEEPFTDPVKFSSLAAFLAFQYMRTPKIMRASIDAVASSSALMFNIDASWGLMRTMFATNIGASFTQSRGTMRATFLESHPTISFITSDQPAINVAAHNKVPEEPASELVLYYPLSPHRALLLAFDAKCTMVERRSLSAAETLDYNRLLFDMSDRQVYASREQELVDASMLVGDHDSGPVESPT